MGYNKLYRMRGGENMFGRRKGLDFNRPIRRRIIDLSDYREIINWVLQIAGVLLLALLLVKGFGNRTGMVGSSMEPTINSSQQVLVNRFTYLVGHPDAGDVVTFLPNGNEKSHYYIRRVAAVPGDRLVITQGILYINDVAYNDPEEGDALIEYSGMAEDEITLSEDEYFLLGDNVNNSEDSRYANIGIVKESDIKGRVWFRFGGFRTMGFVH